MSKHVENQNSIEGPTSLAKPVHRLIQFWLSLGFPESKIKEIYGDHYDHLEDWRYRIPADLTGQALSAVSEYFNDTTIAFKTGLNISIPSIQLFGHILLTSPTLRDVIQTSIQFQQVGTQGLQPILDEGDTQSSYGFIVPSYSPFNAYQVELAVAISLKMLSEVMDYSTFKMEVHLKGENKVLEKSNLINIPIYTGCEKNQILFETDMLSKPINMSSELLLESSKSSIRKRYKELKSEAMFPQLCQSIVEEYLNKGSSNLDYLAELLQISRRTLQTRLSDQNTSFRNLLDKARCHKLKELLDQDAALECIVSELGFSSESAFLESFERWKGIDYSSYSKNKQ